MDQSKPQSLFPLEQCPQVCDEAFNTFHSIDRELFTRLIHNLGRDPSLSMQVVGFFIWLEKQSKDMNFIQRILSLPLLLLNELFDEAAICLKCAESDSYPFLDSNDVVISLLPGIMSNPVVSARYFHENRTTLLRGVTKIVDTVCVRAFRDILQRSWQAHLMGGSRVLPVPFLGAGNVVGESSRMAERNEIGGGFGVSQMGPLPPRLPPPPGLLYNPYLAAPFGQLPSPRGVGTGVMIPMRPPPPPPRGVLPNVHRTPAVQHMNPIPPVRMLVPGSFPPVKDSEVESQLVGNELMQMLDQDEVISNREEVSNVNYGEQVEAEQVAVEAEDVAADDRTIFLTFSKGYPVTEDEVREFFIKRFGDFMEELIMQEVSEDEQVLFARMVVKPQSLAVIRGICGNNRIKYSINGKHVHARKYVKKSSQASTSRSSRQTTRPTEEQSQAS